jgi:hypothetical protein
MSNPSLDLYLWLIDHFRDGMIHTVVSDGHNVPDNARESNPAVIHARLRAARIFNVPITLAEDAYDEVTQYVSSLVHLGTERELAPEQGTDLIKERGWQLFPEI